MIKIYINPDGKQVQRPKSLVLDGWEYIPPTDEQLISAGWEIKEIIEPVPEQYLPTIEELVESKLRERYSINQEFEVQRKRDTEPEAFSAYYAYVEECIEWAHQQIDESNE